MFRKRPEKALGETLGSNIAGRVDQMQRRLADYLNRRVESCSKGTVLFALVMFCLIVGSYLVYLLLDALGIFS